MKLKTSSFNITLLLDTLQKKWWFFVINFIALFFTRPVPFLMSFDTLRQRNADLFETGGLNLLSQQELFRLLKSFANSFFATGGFYEVLMVVTIIISALSSVVMFSYLYSKKEVNFYHSLPVRRESLFGASYIVGALTFILPYLAAEGISLICAGVTGVFGYIDPGAYALSILAAVVLFMAAYTVGVLSAMLAGNVFSHLCGIIVLNFGILFCVLVQFSMMQVFFKTFYSASFEKILVRISPYVYMVYMGSQGISGLMIFLYAALTVLLFFGCLWLYRRRASEKATISLVFDKTKPYFKYLIVFWGAAFLGLFFKEISGIPFMIFGFAAGGFIAHMACEVTFEKDFRAMMKNKKGYLIFCLIFAVFVSLFAFDLTHYDSYVPKPSAIESVVFDDYASNIYYIYGGSNEEQALEYTSQEDIRYVTDMAHLAVDYYQSGGQGSNNMRTILLCYRKAPFGWKTYRRYSVPLDQIQGSYKAIYDGALYKEKYMEQLRAIPVADVYELSVDSAFNRNNLINLVRGNEAFSDVKTKLLIDAYMVDLQNRTFDGLQKSDLACTVNMSANHNYITFEERQGRFSSASLPVYETDANTLRVLQEQFGVKSYQTIKQEFMDQIDYVRVVPVIRQENEKPSAAAATKESAELEVGIRITDKEQIRQIMDACTTNRENLIMTDGNYDVYAVSEIDPGQFVDPKLAEKYGLEAESSAVHFEFKLGQVPDFIKNQTKLS